MFLNHRLCIFITNYAKNMHCGIDFACINNIFPTIMSPVKRGQKREPMKLLKNNNSVETAHKMRIIVVLFKFYMKKCKDAPE